MLRNYFRFLAVAASAGFDGGAASLRRQRGTSRIRRPTCRYFTGLPYRICGQRRQRRSGIRSANDTGGRVSSHRSRYGSRHC